MIFLLLIVYAVVYSISGFLVSRTVIPDGVATHMLEHLAIMNLAAPLLGFALWRALRHQVSVRPASWWAAVVLQISLLYAWHAPTVMSLASTSFGVLVVGNVGLLSVAGGFWFLAASLARSEPWHVIAGLLISGKLACFLGVVYVFAPRLLSDHHGSSAILADQQQAGLMMLVACPLTFVGSAVVLMSWWLYGKPQDSGGVLPVRHVH